MEQTRLPRCTNEVEIIPFNNVTIKQEEVESSDSVDMVASYNEDIDVKEEQDQEVDMDPSLTATMMSVVLKDDSNASSGDVEELVVEPSLLEFRCFHDDNDDDDNDRQECYLDEYGHFENAASESKRLKYALKKSRSGSSGGRHAGAGAGPPPSRDAIFRCPHCHLCLTTSDYLSRHVRRGCRFRDAPIKNAYRCTQCGAGFSNYGELFQHRRRAHSDPQCPFKVNAPSKPRLPAVGFPDLPLCALPPSASRTPDLVVSSSAAVNHFEAVVPDVAANSDPPAAARCLAPDIVSCSRPAPASTAAPTAARGESTPPDVVVATAPRDTTHAQPGGGNLMRLNCNALKRRNPETSARSVKGAQK